MKKTLLIIVGLLVVGVAVLTGIAWHPALAAITTPPVQTFSPQQIKQGGILAGIGNCASCHTVKGGAAYAGGLALATPFGTIYSSNITPDPTTGIGHWSQEAFQRALREGISRDGSNLFPAFPYTHFAHVSDADSVALYAYLMTRPAVKQPTLDNTLPFPLNVRLLQASWKWLYFDQKPLTVDTAKSIDWNRGRYLGEGLAHCAACHTPRNALGAESASKSYLGAELEGWFAPALTAANPSVLPWSETDIYDYLRNGASSMHGIAAGPMSDVVHHGLAAAPDADIHALAVYYADINSSAATKPDAKQTSIVIKRVTAQSAKVSDIDSNHGAALYVAACASCHTNSNGQVNPLRPELGLSSSLVQPNPNNLVQVILYGINREDGMPGLMMPGFASALSNDDVAQLAAYLRSSRSNASPWPELESKIAALRSAHQP